MRKQCDNGSTCKIGKLLKPTWEVVVLALLWIFMAALSIPDGKMTTLLVAYSTVCIYAYCRYQQGLLIADDCQQQSIESDNYPSDGNNNNNNDLIDGCRCSPAYSLWQQQCESNLKCEDLTIDTWAVEDSKFDNEPPNPLGTRLATNDQRPGAGIQVESVENKNIIQNPMGNQKVAISGQRQPASIQGQSARYETMVPNPMGNQDVGANGQRPGAGIQVESDVNKNMVQNPMGNRKVATSGQRQPASIQGQSARYETMVPNPMGNRDVGANGQRPDAVIQGQSARYETMVPNPTGNQDVAISGQRPNAVVQDESALYETMLPNPAGNLDVKTTLNRGDFECKDCSTRANKPDNATGE